MIKNCILYELSGSRNAVVDIHKKIPINVTLEECYNNSVGGAKPKLKSLMQLARDEKLMLIDELSEQNVFSVECQFKVPKLLATGETPFVPVNYDIWLRKKSQFVITFDAGRKLSNVGISLLGYAIAKDAAFIKPIEFNPDFFSKLIHWASSEKSSGDIKGVTFTNTEYNRARFKNIVLNGNELEDTELFKSLIESTEAISNLSLTSPELKASGRQLRFRLNYWGSLTIYTPNLLESEIKELIANIEGIAAK